MNLINMIKMLYLYNKTQKNNIMFTKNSTKTKYMANNSTNLEISSKLNI